MDADTKRRQEHFDIVWQRFVVEKARRSRSTRTQETASMYAKTGRRVRSCHATHWRRHLDEWGGELTVCPYDPEKCSGEGPPWPVWIGAAPPLGSPAPATPRPMECSVCGAGYIGSRAGEECGVEGCDGRLYFVAAETGEPAYMGDGTETLEGWVAPYSEGLWTFEEGEADPHPTSIRASLVLRGVPKFGGHWAEVRGSAPTAAEPEREAPTPEQLRAMAEWFDDPKNPSVDVAVGPLSRKAWTAGYLLRGIAAATERALATPKAEGGSK